MSHATEAATNSAQIILLNNQMELISDAFDLSGNTLKIIRQNLWWALGYNICLIPLAAIGILPPMWGALSMAISDIIVVGNSLRLHFKPVFSRYETTRALDSPMVSQPV
jgi:Cu+-exporting ATPase